MNNFFALFTILKRFLTQHVTDSNAGNTCGYTFVQCSCHLLEQIKMAARGMTAPFRNVYQVNKNRDVSGQINGSKSINKRTNKMAPPFSSSPKQIKKINKSVMQHTIYSNVHRRRTKKKKKKMKKKKQHSNNRLTDLIVNNAIIF